MKASTTRFDAADYLDSEERQIAYVKVAIESGDAGSSVMRAGSLLALAACVRLRRKPA